KTTVATGLALAADAPVRLVDCDVEEPNAHIFLRPDIEHVETVEVLVPRVDETKCTACGACGRICRFNAIVSLKSTAMVFPELCHGCGGCALVCESGAITEVPREVGVVERGRAGEIAFVHGRLNVGEAMSPPLIRAVKAHAGGDGLTIIDAPPGTSCPVVTAVRGADFAILVTEPTPFGLNDLKLAVEMVRALDVPAGVLINRADVGDDAVRDYCRDEGIALVAEIAHDRRIAEAYSRGIPAVEALPELRAVFRDVLDAVGRHVRRGPS
ncbi:MAG TPA: ATP-binding protein, partial [Planctomycetota bacterium]|nr:ATP-binding protein [Planctomycetota bacterium]